MMDEQEKLMAYAKAFMKEPVSSDQVGAEEQESHMEIVRMAKEAAEECMTLLSRPDVQAYFESNLHLDQFLKNMVAMSYKAVEWAMDEEVEGNFDAGMTLLGNAIAASYAKGRLDALEEKDK